MKLTVRQSDGKRKGGAKELTRVDGEKFVGRPQIATGLTDSDDCEICVLRSA